MPGIMSPQSQAGISSFYDAQTRGPKLNPKIVLACIVAFALIIIIINAVIAYGL